MQLRDGFILCLNAGSSSLKFALYGADEQLRRHASGHVDGIGTGRSRFSFHSSDGKEESRAVSAVNHAGAARVLLEWLGDAGSIERVHAAGHRVVHGGPHYSAPALVTPDLLAELQRISPYDPEHLPAELALIDLCRRELPDLPQVACFDTAFHRSMPAEARLLPIPRRFAARGVERYGFHGLSYAFLMEELARIGGPHAAAGRVILAHLGNGSSLAAVSAGRSIDTTMAFTPAAGVPMGTRSGDLDPGLVRYLEQAEGMTIEAFHRMVNAESGLLGLSETSGDMRILLEREASDSRAAEAVALYCYQVRKAIGAFAAALGGLDALVFAGGIGENAAPVRARICEGLGFLGIELDPVANASGAPVISAPAGRVAVRVIHTNEELMIARAVRLLLGEAQRAAREGGTP